MARSGVTYAEIARAARTLLADGQEPTVERVRLQMGTGSNSTIAPLLRRWRAEQQQGIDADDLPEDLIEALKALQNRVRGAAQVRIERAEAEFDARFEDAQRQLAESRQGEAKLDSERTTLQATLAEFQTKNEGLLKTLEATRIAAARTEGQRDEALSQLASIKAALADEQARNDALQARFEHYQERSAEQRQQEREEHRLAAQNAQAQIAQLLDQLNKSHSRFDQLQQAYKQLEAELSRQREGIQALHDKNTRLKADMESLLLRLKEVIAERDKWQSAHEHQQGRTAALSGELTAARGKLEQLEHQLQAAQAALNAAERRAAVAQQENSQILQEKALLQGQLKQLQAGKPRKTNNKTHG